MVPERCKGRETPRRSGGPRPPTGSAERARKAPAAAARLATARSPARPKRPEEGGPDEVEVAALGQATEGQRGGAAGQQAHEQEGGPRPSAANERLPVEDGFEARRREQRGEEAEEGTDPGGAAELREPGEKGARQLGRAVEFPPIASINAKPQRANIGSCQR